MSADPGQASQDQAFWLREELVDLIKDRATNAPRSLQKELGPSDVAHPCMRKMAYSILDAPGSNPPFDPLPSIVGIAVHAWLESAARAANNKLGRTRWLTETRVSPADWLQGNSDLFDLDTGTVVDWKGQHVATPIPTTDGWKKMGELTVGDQLFDSQGQVCSVVETFPLNERDCYRIIFDDGTDTICDDIHEWPVLFGPAIQSGAQRGQYRERLMTAPQIMKDLRAHGQRQVRVTNGAPLQLPEADLPIHPYLLGAWLGDGCRGSGLISKPDLELFTNIEDDGAEIVHRKLREDGLRIVRIVGLTEALRKQHLIENKHIPSRYLRASHQQRLLLLQGLMDTDGTWNRIRNQAVFTTASKALACQTAELVSTLGWKPRVWELTKRGFGLTVTAYDVTFIPFGDNPFRISRKAELVRPQGTAHAKRRVIRSVERTLTVPTRCIQVDSPDNTYLSGEQMIPTHNCLGNTSFRKYKKEMSPVYKAQTNIYGLGYERAGLTVNNVAVMLIPKAGLIANAHLWVEPYDRSVAEATLERRNQVLCLLNDLDIENNLDRLEWLEKSGPACNFCKWWSPRPSGPLQCPGAEE